MRLQACIIRRAKAHLDGNLDTEASDTEAGSLTAKGKLGDRQ